MSRKLLTLGTVVILSGSAAIAEVPRVATDIAPVHSLVARVMDGLGTPELVIAQGASPHEYSLRPSAAGALQGADLIFWVGEELTPWMGGALETLSDGATVTELLKVEGTTLLEFRESALFEMHDHGHGNEVHEHEGHDHGAHDPHAWLSPDNAAHWLETIAAALSSADPENADTYTANAAAGIAELQALTDEIDATLAPVRGSGFIVFHDAYRYFETAFDIPASGAISLSDASEPSPARIAEVRERVNGKNISCVLSEPQFNPGLVAAVMDGADASTAVLDSLGSGLELGPGLYPQLLRNLANALAGCL